MPSGHCGGCGLRKELFGGRCLGCVAPRRRFGNTLPDERAHYSDGRTVPEIGDDVYQVVAGAFGMQAVIEGKVFKGRGGLRVKVTGGGGALGIGHAPVGKTYALSPHWSLRDDPAIQAMEEAKERTRIEREAEKRSAKARAEAAIENKAKQLGLRRISGIHDVHVGDEAYSLVSAADGDPDHVDVDAVTVTGLGKDYFLHLSEHGSEVTSGKPELWWRKR